MISECSELNPTDRNYSHIPSCLILKQAQWLKSLWCCQKKGVFLSSGMCSQSFLAPRSAMLCLASIFLGELRKFFVYIHWVNGDHGSTMSEWRWWAQELYECKERGLTGLFKRRKGVSGREWLGDDEGSAEI